MQVPCLDVLVKAYNYYGFPVVDGEKLLGFVTRDKLRIALGTCGTMSISYSMNNLPQVRWSPSVQILGVRVRSCRKLKTFLA